MLTAYQLDFEEGTQILALDQSDAFIKRYPNSFGGESMLAEWGGWDAYVINPTARRGDFFGFNSGVYALTAVVAEKFSDLFAAVGELLPIRVDGEQLFLLNVLRAPPGALDPDKSQWMTVLGKRLQVTQFEFHSDVVAGESIFRLADLFGVIIAMSGQEDRSLDFYARYRASRLSGLWFKPIWTAEV